MPFYPARTGINFHIFSYRGAHSDAEALLAFKAFYRINCIRALLVNLFISSNTVTQITLFW